MKTVRLAEVTADNWEAVVALKLRKKQAQLLTSNLYSIAESKFDAGARPRAIYAGRRLVGFLMYDVGGRGRRRIATIYRFMIDKRHQGHGYGHAALTAAIDEIKRLGDVAKIVVLYMPDNHSAGKLYESLGFRDAGDDEDGERVAELVL